MDEEGNIYDLFIMYYCSICRKELGEAIENSS
jgi:hypothetical protein